MKTGIILKKAWSHALHNSGVLPRKLIRKSKNHGVILTYHRILPRCSVTDYLEPGMYVTPSTFRSHIIFLKRYFEIISIEHAEHLIAGNAASGMSKPYCVISFDDGWLDYFTYAWPVLSEERAPSVVFLPTGLIGKEDMFWTDRLASILEFADVDVLVKSLKDKGFSDILINYGSIHKNIAGAIGILKHYSYHEIDAILNSCESLIGSKGNNTGRSFITWDNVRYLYSTGLVSFGSHTVNHAILTTLSSSDVIKELNESRDKLMEEKIINNCIPFSYPNGNYTQDIVNLVKNAGFSSAVTCDSGWNAPGDNMFHLKRISIHEDISSSAPLFSYRLTQYEG